MRALLLFTALGLGCSSSDSTTGPSDATLGDGTAGDAPLDTAPPANACVTGGGQCGCAGGCPTGSHHGSFTEDEGCPQPCAGCGACSEWCCFPDTTSSDAGDAGDAGDAPTDG